MSKATHTPGPWHAGWLDAQNGWILDDADKYLAQIVTSDEEGKLAPRKEHKANALLLASAPDLLDALNSIIDYAECEIRDRRKLISCPEEEADVKEAKSLLDKARAAIARAEGR